jgi:hypothetical protein
LDSAVAEGVVIGRGMVGIGVAGAPAGLGKQVRFR